MAQTACLPASVSKSVRLVPGAVALLMSCRCLLAAPVVGTRRGAAANCARSGPNDSSRNRDRRLAFHQVTIQQPRCTVVVAVMSCVPAGCERADDLP